MSGAKTPPGARPSIAAMAGYTPGEQPKRGEKVIKLNTNENPYPPSPKVTACLRGIDPEDLRRYPNPMADRFREVAARLYGLTPENVLAGNGSDDILNIAIRTFLDPGAVLAYPEPTYSLYPVLAEIHGATVRTVPWNDGWSLPADALLGTGARMVFLANPNAPSGTAVAPDAIAAFAERFAGVVLVDEAYAEFADESCLPLLRTRANVIVCRTLSKSYALAGLRFGYALAAPELIAEMTKVKDSYNCDAVSIAAATAALEDQDHARDIWQRIRAERRRLADALTARGYDVLPSQSNFVFARPPQGEAGAIYRALKGRGILVRFFDQPGISDRLRITVGRPEENDALLKALGGL